MIVIFVILGAVGALSITVGGITALSLWLVGFYFDIQTEHARLGKTELVNPAEAGEVLGAVECRRVGR